MVGNDDSLLGRLTLPVGPGEPATVTCKHPALRLAVVERAAVSHLTDDWDVAGVYLLLGPVGADGTYDAYVGKAALQGLRSRLKGPDHKTKDHWTRALLVARDATEAFHSAEVGWLEGRLWDLLKNAPAARLVNKPQPKDETLHPSERAFLEACVAPVAGLLRVLGASPDTLDQLATKPARKPRRRYDETVADLIDAELLAVGSRLHPVETKFTTVATVLANGSLEVSGNTYAAVSEAAATVAGSTRNGWDFWGVPSGSGSLVSLAELRARLVKTKAVGKGAPTIAQAPPRTANVPAGGKKNVTPSAVKARTPKAPNAKVPMAKAANRHRSDEEKGTTVAAMIAAGFLTAPVALRGTYSGRTFDAVAATDGNVSFDGATYSLSGAGKAAKVAVRGSSAPTSVLATDGWSFWQARDGDHKWVSMGELRRLFVAAKSTPA